MKIQNIAFLALFFTIIAICQSKITRMGFLNADESIDLMFAEKNPEDGLEYTFMTNYKKISFELINTPSTDQSYRQRIILSDHQFSTCPQRCTEVPNYCTAASNRIYAKTEAMFSKGFPKLYAYIINQPITPGLNLLEDSENNNPSNIDLSTTQLAAGITTDGVPIFNLKPTRFSQSGRVLNSLVPQCASLSIKDCIDPELCTTECKLLTCQSEEGEGLFSLGTADEFTAETLTNICSASSKFQQKFTLSKCENPIPYYPTLANTSASILLLCLVLMATLIICVCFYNMRLNKTNQEPWDVCLFCPEGLFPKAKKGAY